MQVRKKNIGPAGLTVVIIRDDLLNEQSLFAPMLDYRVQADSHSMYNTPPTFSIYMAKLVFEWLQDLGGVSQMVKYNQQKSGLLYDAIDRSNLFQSPVNKKDRSLTNIPFLTASDQLNQEFINAAQRQGFENLKGHRSVGGMRASLYNAFLLTGVERLVDFMQEFEKAHGGD